MPPLPKATDEVDSDADGTHYKMPVTTTELSMNDTSRHHESHQPANESSGGRSHGAGSRFCHGQRLAPHL